MNAIYHPDSSRGLADHGWLVSRHTFSFAGYFNPERMHFGALRVLNDDMVQPSMGFATHPHDNMEIVSIPLSGSLRHRDSMGNTHIIAAGEVQIMSAGSGLTHSEFNNSDTDDVRFLQIWVLPKERDIAPRYDQKVLSAAARKNTFQLLVSPQVSEATVWINQNAWFSLAEINAGQEVVYTKQGADSGVYFFIIEGDGRIDGHEVHRRDGLGLVEGQDHAVHALSDALVLAIEVPMTVHH